MPRPIISFYFLNLGFVSNAKEIFWKSNCIFPFYILLERIPFMILIGAIDMAMAACHESVKNENKGCKVSGGLDWW